MFEATIIACTAVVLFAIWGMTHLILEAVDQIHEKVEKCERWRTP